MALLLGQSTSIQIFKSPRENLLFDDQFTAGEILGMRHTSPALYFYRASKKSLISPETLLYQSMVAKIVHLQNKSFHY
jgi:hypothetical protein